MGSSFSATSPPTSDATHHQGHSSRRARDHHGLRMVGRKPTCGTGCPQERDRARVQAHWASAKHRRACPECKAQRRTSCPPQPRALPSLLSRASRSGHHRDSCPVARQSWSWPTRLTRQLPDNLLILAIGKRVRNIVRSDGVELRHLISVVATVLMGCAAGFPTQNLQALKVEPLDRRCIQVADCVIVGTTCSACECGTPVNRATRPSYEAKLSELCRNYAGPACRYSCTTPFATCREGECALTAEP